MGNIDKVCVIGAGVMGAGIAAQVANAGVPVLLLDIVPPAAGEGADRSAIARGAVERMLKGAAAFMSPEAAGLVTVGNLEDDLHRVAECQWVVEVVVERLDIKQALYRRLDAVCPPGVAISSNTSTIQLATLLQGMGEGFRRRFGITHFFNPPRHMRLLELVTGPDTDPALFGGVADFIDRRMGKTVVRTHDTPGFIANRIGTFWLQHGVNQAIAQGVTVEEADAVMGRPLGIPRTGLFGLLDLIGLDLMPHIARSMTEALPGRDPFHDTVREQPVVARMIADGYTGRKGKGGFYRVNKGADGRGRLREAIDLCSGAFAPAREPTLPAALGRDPAALMFSDDRLGRFAWSVMGDTLCYAAGLVPEIADDLPSVDAAMRLGFNWKQGPFELLDAIGPARVAARLEREGRPVPALLRAVGDGTFHRLRDGVPEFLGTDGAYRRVAQTDGVLLLEEVKRRGRPLAGNRQASLWDIGEGVACFEIHSKMNAIDDAVLDALEQGLALMAGRFRALVIGGDAANFSAGANLAAVLADAGDGNWTGLEAMLERGQTLFKRLKYAPFPVVAAAAGVALGGGCEVLLHADAVVAHAETQAGLVETAVGVVPAWGGCGEMLARAAAAGGGDPAAAVFDTLRRAKRSSSAAEARALGLLRDGDEIVMNRDRLLFAAREKALALAEGYAPPAEPRVRLSGPAGRAAMLDGVSDAAPHELVVADALAGVLSGGDQAGADGTGEMQLLALERAAFMQLLRTEATQARIRHMLDTGKPLRN